MTNTPHIKLYFSNFSRGTRPRWFLEELGVPHELVRVDMKAKEHKAADYIEKIHPHGAVPACEIDGVHIIESGAIVAALADRFLDKGFAPKPDSKERAVYLQWMFYGYATVEPALIALLEARKPELGVADDKKVAAEAQWKNVASFIEKSLAKKTWILGETFSAADVILGSIVAWAASSKAFEGSPNVLAYVDRIKARPAFNAARK